MTSDAFVQVQRDARGVVTLTLNRPAAFNALSEGMHARRAAGRTRRSPATKRVRVVVLAAAGKGLLRRPRPEGDARLAVARYYPRCSIAARR